MATYDSYKNPIKDVQDLQEEEKISALVSNIKSKFYQAETTREDDEDRWLQAFHNYRGRYFKNVAFRDHEKSRVFVASIIRIACYVNFEYLFNILLFDIRL